MSGHHTCPACNRWAGYARIKTAFGIKALQCTICKYVSRDPFEEGPEVSASTLLANVQQDQAAMNAQMAAANQARQEQTAQQRAAGYMPYSEKAAATQALDDASKRIAELEKEQRTWQANGRELANLRVRIREELTRADEQSRRAERFEDHLGRLRDDNDDLLRENAILRRKLEAAERKAKR